MSHRTQVILVTGASGLIGYAACEALTEAGYPVVGLDRPGRPYPPPHAEDVACDLTDEQSVSEAMARVRRDFGERVASVIHLAAYYDFSGEPSPLYDEVTVRGTERLLRSLAALQVEQIVYGSTMLVHAPCQPGERINEDWPVDPKWDYPKSKLAAERVIRERREGIPAVLLRIAGVYTDRCRSVPLAHQIQRIYERRLTAKVFPGDTSTGQSFLHLDDLVQALLATVAHRTELPPESTILLGEPGTVSYDDLQRELAWQIHGDPDWDTARIPKALAKAGAWVQDQTPGIEDPFIKPWMIELADDHYALDVSRAHQALGWEPRRKLRDTLPAMVAALKADPERWYRDHELEGSPAHDEEAAVAGRAAD